MKTYKIDFDLLNKEVYLNYNQTRTIASSITFTADKVSSYAFYPARPNTADSEDDNVFDYYTMEWFSSEDHYIFIQRHSLTDSDNKVIEKDILLNISVFTKGFMDNQVTFQDLYSIFLDNTERNDMAVREGFLAGIIDMCAKRKIETSLYLR